MHVPYGAAALLLYQHTCRQDARILTHTGASDTGMAFDLLTTSKGAAAIEEDSPQQQQTEAAHYGRQWRKDSGLNCKRWGLATMCSAQPCSSKCPSTQLLLQLLHLTVPAERILSRQGSVLLKQSTLAAGSCCITTRSRGEKTGL
jgi:hypothetical protein